MLLKRCLAAQGNCVHGGAAPRYTALLDTTMKQLIAISAIGSDRTGLVAAYCGNGDELFPQ